MKLTRWALCALAAVTRRVHPRGTDRIVRRLHGPDRRSRAIEAVVPLGNGLRMHASTASYLEWKVFFFGAYEPQVSAIISRYVRPGHSAIDVGANVGIHTLAMARAVRHGSVLACEPNPAICARLSANLALNGVTNVLVRQVAVLDREGPVELYVPSDAHGNQGTASLQRNPDHLADGHPVRVPGTTIDELVAAAGVMDVDLIKIDVEGFEGAALRGARGVLERDHPALVFEYNPDYWGRAGYAYESVLAELHALGYGTFLRITRKGPVPIPSRPPTYTNMLAV